MAGWGWTPDSFSAVEWDGLLLTHAISLQSEQGAADKCNQPYRKHSKHAWVTYRLAVQLLWLQPLPCPCALALRAACNPIERHRGLP